MHKSRLAGFIIDSVVRVQRADFAARANTWGDG
jgi:hypothetical protein